MFDVSAYLIIPIWSSIKVYVVAIDVIHSLGFYTFGIKIDAIPIGISRYVREYLGKNVK